MTTPGFIIAMTIIAILMLVSFYRAKHEEKTSDSENKRNHSVSEVRGNETSDVHEQNNDSSKLTLDDGKTLDYEQILHLDAKTLSTMSEKNLKLLLNYAGHRIVDASDEDKPLWRNYFELVNECIFGHMY